MIEYNLTFFTEYLRRLEHDENIDDLKNFIKEKHFLNEDRYNLNKSDIIEENLHAFDHGTSFSNTRRQEKKPKENKNKNNKRRKSEYNENEDVERIPNDNIVNAKSTAENYNDENYFSDLIKKNFYA